VKDHLEGPLFEMPDDQAAANKLLLPITRTGLLPFEAPEPGTPATGVRTCTHVSLQGAGLSTARRRRRVT